MRQYHQLLTHVLDNGTHSDDRTGTGTTTTFGYQMRFDLSDGSLPLLTTKKMHIRGIVEELLWFLRGDTNAKSLQERGVHIWDEWASEDGSLGRIYGAQWRSWLSIASDGTSKVTDQIAELLRSLSTNPESRRHVVAAWNPGELNQMALPPCHCLFQFHCARLTLGERETLYRESDPSPDSYEEFKCTDPSTLPCFFSELGIPKYRLSCQLYQRSADAFLGVPYNIASYSILTRLIAQQVNMVPGEFIHTFGDLHIYDNHRAQVTEILSRMPRELPKLEIRKAPDLLSYAWVDFTLSGYDPYPAIKAEVSV